MPAEAHVGWLGITEELWLQASPCRQAIQAENAGARTVGLLGAWPPAIAGTAPAALELLAPTACCVVQSVHSVEVGTTLAFKVREDELRTLVTDSL